MHLYTVCAHCPEERQDICVIVEIFPRLDVGLYPGGVGPRINGKLPLPHLPPHTPITGQTEGLHQQVNIVVLVILTKSYKYSCSKCIHKF